MSTLSYKLADQLNKIYSGGAGNSARFPVLVYMALRSNRRGRCWSDPSTIQEATGLGKTAVRDAMEWLQDAKAIVNVPPEFRMGQEARIRKDRPVWQVTGIIQVDDDEVIEVLHMKPSDIQEMREELEKIGAVDVAALFENEPEKVDDKATRKAGGKVRNPASEGRAENPENGKQMPENGKQMPENGDLPLYERESLKDSQRQDAKSVQPDGSTNAEKAAAAAGEIFRIFEQNIGLITPLIADEIKDWLATYPQEWIKDAIKEAAMNQGKTPKYILRILERWAREGKTAKPPTPPSSAAPPSPALRFDRGGRSAAHTRPQRTPDQMPQRPPGPMYRPLKPQVES